ncbi:MAG: hypothetical protein AAGJ79_01325 [Verrucomicrobiota bacterium]
MAFPPNDTHDPLKEPVHNPDELKHDAVPGYPKAFFIAFTVMGLYLLMILLSSPGPAKGSHSSKYKSDHGSESKSSH